MTHGSVRTETVADKWAGPNMGSFLESITVEDLETDPYPIYARLRREAPVAYVPAVNSWLATRWDDVAAIGKDPDLFSAEDPNAPVCVAFGMPAIIPPSMKVTPPACPINKAMR